MKKTLLYLMVLALTGFSAKGQLTKNWEIKPVATGGLILTSGNTTTIAYNKITDKIYLPDRNNKISILKSDGTLSSPSLLTTDAAWVESYKYTKIRVADDGAIYAVNMTLGAGTLYIYRWASESDAAPVRSAISVNVRAGDSFGVSGSGVNTILYISGAGATGEIYICTTTDGINFLKTKTILLPTVSARSSISPVANSLTSDLWINTLNVETRRISIDAAGTITGTAVIPNATINQVYSHAEYFEEGSSKFLAVVGAHNNPLGLDFRLYNVTNLASVSLVASSSLAPDSYSANTNAYADVAMKKNENGTFTFYHLAFGNGLAAYTTATSLPVSLSSFDASLKNGASTLSWSTSSESNNKGFEVQKSTDGKEFKVIDFISSKADNGNSSSVINYSYVDQSATSGTNYYRLNQIDLNGNSKLYDVKAINVGLASVSIEVYPNPTSLNVKVKAADFKGLKYDLYNSSGKIVKSAKASSEITEIATSELSPSVYILKVIKDGKVVDSKKIVKQ